VSLYDVLVQHYSQNDFDLLTSSDLDLVTLTLGQGH